MGNERKPQDDKGKQPNRIEDPIPKRPEIADPDLEIERDDRNALGGDEDEDEEESVKPRRPQTDDAATQDRGRTNPNNPSLDPERKGSIDRQGNR